MADGAAYAPGPGTCACLVGAVRVFPPPKETLGWLRRFERGWRETEPSAAPLCVPGPGVSAPAVAGSGKRPLRENEGDRGFRGS